MSHPSEGHLAPYAIVSDDSSGRHHLEPEDPLRSTYELDRHRIIESAAFRRLEGKTQVFSPSDNDHFRTRLTHTLEVAQVARTLAVGLGANELLAEAITLAHDLGHPPFGHAGERALAGAMADSGGFNHNGHSLRIVEYLEHPIPAFRGLNLSIETLDGLATHETIYDRPLTGGEDTGERASAFPSIESRIASISDRIAYDCHDLEDAIGAGFVDLESLGDVRLWAQAVESAKSAAAASNIFAIRRVVLDAILNALLTDVIFTSQELLIGIESPQQARASASPLVALSPDMDGRLREMERFLVEHVYCQPAIAKGDEQGRHTVLRLFEAYRAEPERLPDRYAARVDEQSVDRVVCDYIAGMTDAFCQAMYGSLHRTDSASCLNRSTFGIEPC